ncbi:MULTISPECIES: NUDIX hydrolase [Clostridia]|jgi:coenzyme A diphosphatase NUDT7|uniref:NUDIX hydrolase n=1 Tax=Clostridia TaxID=186801 RepID=UPI000E48AAF6|nr:MULTISPECIES: CoA pyrophosphatase [Clostridia]RHV70017.1 CoA pyrophosphatase [Roseburia sp. OM02-15]
MENLKDILAHHTPTFIGMDQCHQAAVCIPLLKNASGGYDVLFEVRAATIAHQPGDVCLPGGMVEEGETPREAALRELQEELLLNKDQICYLGDMDKLYTGSRLIMYSFAAEVTEYQNTFSPAEVDEVFHVPLEFFLHTEPKCYITRARVEPGEDFPYDLICGGREYNWRSRKEDVCFYQYEGHVIWGLTAKVIRAFAEVVRS